MFKHVLLILWLGYNVNPGTNTSGLMNLDGLVVWLPWILFSHMLGMSSSQLTNSYFSEGWPNHQPDLDGSTKRCDLLLQWYSSNMFQWSTKAQGRTETQSGHGWTLNSTKETCTDYIMKHMYVYIYIYVRILYIYIHSYIYLYTHTQTYICTYKHVYIYTPLHIYIYTYIHVYMYTCIRVYIYIYLLCLRAHVQTY